MTCEEMNTERVIPPADILLGLLNEDPGSDEAFLRFYDDYIRAASIEHLGRSGGNRGECYLNEDLMQEIRMAVLKSLPILRRTLLEKHLVGHPSRDPIVVIVTTTENILNT